MKRIDLTGLADPELDRLAELFLDASMQQNLGCTFAQFAGLPGYWEPLARQVLAGAVVFREQNTGRIAPRQALGIC